MFSFFRKIRNNSISSGSTQRYLFYALGEILLVMIGILLALQVNNWNENRKDRIKEKTVLVDLVETIESNCNILRNAINTCKTFNQSSEYIISFLDDEIQYADSLKLHFEWSSFQGGDVALSLSYAGYEALKNAGFDIISNDLINKQIIYLFETTIPMIQIVKDRWRPLYTGYNTYTLNSFSMEGNGFIPRDPKILSEDPYYHSMINSIKFQRENIIDVLSDCLEESEKVLKTIKKELRD